MEESEISDAPNPGKQFSVDRELDEVDMGLDSGKDRRPDPRMAWERHSL